VWRSNFGKVLAAGVGAAIFPEPDMMALAGAMSGLGLLWRRG
jgi:hypothetical protein